MSDFDREAERKRLEEKYEKDREKRKSTQRMSELLLKGATMTNRHCDECGSPIFRHDGQEFCPSCQGQGAGESVDATEGAETTAEDAVDGSTPSGDATDPGSTQDVEPGADATDAAGGTEGATEAETPAAAGGSGAEVPAEGADASDPHAVDPEQTAGSGAPKARGNERGQSESATGASDASANAAATGETRRDARDALLRALRSHAERATDADDPRRAREHLEAAREAAETLSALDR